MYSVFTQQIFSACLCLLLSILAAARIAELLASRGVQLEMIIDEGISVATRGIEPFTKQPLALVGTAEKQLQCVQVSVARAVAVAVLAGACTAAHCCYRTSLQ
jgi:hypothetical protein